MGVRTVVVFPGQGSYLPGALGELARFREVSEVLAAVDDAARDAGFGAVRPLLTEADAPGADVLVEQAPERLHLAIYGTSVALWAVFTERLGVEADAVLGHSVGELAAFVAAGAFDVAEGARLLCARDIALREAAPDGGMYAVELGAERVGELLRGCGLVRTRVAADNAPRQSVVSGPDAELAQLTGVLDALGVRSFRLRSAYPFHSALLAPAAQRFGAAVGQAVVRGPGMPVYSAAGGGYYERAEDVRGALVDHLLLPVGFRQAVCALYGHGFSRFVEAGAKGILSDLVAGNLPGARVVAPLRTRGGLERIRELLEGDGTPLKPTPRTVSDTTSETAYIAPAPDMPVPAVYATPAPTPPVEPTAPFTPPQPPSLLPELTTLIEELRKLYAEALEYPVEVMSPDADLEADLAVDSVKQIELFARARERYGLPQPEKALRVTTYTTLEKIAALLLELR